MSNELLITPLFPTNNHTNQPISLRSQAVWPVSRSWRSAFLTAHVHVNLNYVYGQARGAGDGLVTKL